MSGNRHTQKYLAAIWIFLLTTSAQPAAAQGGRSAPESEAQIRSEVIAREKASFDAWKRQDWAFYDDYWSSGMTEFLPQSRRLATKDEVMPTLGETMRRWRLDGIEMHDPHVQIYGKVAILTYTETVSGRYDGKPNHYEGKVTMVYVREDGEWKGVHYHESVMEGH